MKFLLTILCITFVFYNNNFAEAETKKVCIDKVSADGKPVLDKNKKQIKECREMKTHKKLEGASIPSK